MKAKRAWIWFLSQSFFIMTVGLSLYLFAKFIIFRINLPSGVCPVESNRTLIYTAIVLALISFILSVIESWYEKKANQRN